MKARLVSIPIGVLILALSAGCWGDVDVVEHPRGDEAWELAHVAEVDESEVVARVDGRPITGEDVLLKWRDNPEWTAREALDAVIEREVLALEAHRRGYHERPQFDFARKQGMVAALLRETVEANAEISRENEEAMYRAVQERRRAPRGLRASHLVILVPREVEDEEGRKRSLGAADREHYWEPAREVIEEARRLLGDRTDDDALREVAGVLNRDYDLGEFEALVNEHLRFPRVGERYRPEALPRGWTTVVAPFAEGAETVAGEERLGQLSESIRTEFGWHLIRVEEHLDEALVDPAVARRFVEEQLLLEAQIAELGVQLRSWGEGVQLELFPERLERSFGAEGF